MIQISILSNDHYVLKFNDEDIADVYVFGYLNLQNIFLDLNWDTSELNKAMHHYDITRDTILCFDENSIFVKSLRSA